jgi:hypothetical protein
MVDKDGLPLYRSFRGTNLADALHRAMISSMGRTKSGPRYLDNLLTFVRHMYIGGHQSEINLTYRSWATAWEI